MMNPDEPLIHLDTLDDLPTNVPAGTVRVVGHGEVERPWIFDGFKWKAESDRPGEYVEFIPATFVPDLGPVGPAIDAHDSILLEANRLINGERAQHYGHPHENFSDIAAMWSAYLDRPVSHLDVVNLMIMLKLARTKRNGYHRDSYTDVAGYAGCAEKIHDREQGE